MKRRKKAKRFDALDLLGEIIVGIGRRGGRIAEENFLRFALSLLRKKICKRLKTEVPESEKIAKGADESTHSGRLARGWRQKWMHTRGALRRNRLSRDRGERLAEVENNEQMADEE
ncbi:hypothetical protein Sjap_018776 [Stephania japonica]|uniref:Uncharacterized protein n=1 Tax=Stephania japonica TaxID=461633 RepID=A0AAP0I9E0_9MAGN